jgi:tight adherence protein B
MTVRVRAGRRTATVAAALLGWLLLGGPANAGPGIDIDHTESTGGRVSVLLGVDRLPSGSTPDLDTVSVDVDGTAVDATVQPVAPGEVDRTTVLALDASNSMAGDGIREAKAAARAFVAAATADVRIGLLTFSGGVRDVVAPTTDRAALTAAIDRIRLSNGTRVYDALAAAVHLAGDDGARSVVLLSDGRDQGGGRSAAEVVSLVRGKSVVVDVVSLGQADRERAVLDGIATASGGSVVLATEPSSLRALFEREAQALSTQLVVAFMPPSDAVGDVRVDVSLTAGGRTYIDSADVSLPAGADVQPSTSAAASGADRGMLLGGAGAVGLGLALTMGVVLLGRGGAPSTDRRLAAYFGEAPAERAPAGLRSSAVEVAHAIVPGDVEARLARRLAGAGLALRPAEWVLLHAGIVVVAGLAGLVVGGPLLMVFLLLAAVAGPVVFLRIKHGRRLAAFGSQLPETLAMIANSLSAGLSVAQSIDTVVRDGQEPMAGELRRALVEQRLGVDIDDALEGVAGRMGSTDFGWVVMAIRIQRGVGGNLSEVLLTVSETLREREYLRRQVRTLSAEGRLSAYILGGLPVVMFCYLMVANRDFVRPLYTQMLGVLMLGVAVTLLTAGSWFMSRLVKVEV